MDRPQAARAKSLQAEQHKRNDTQRRAEKRKESCFLFLEERPEGVGLPSGWKQRQGRATIAALWHRHRRENVADCGLATQLVKGCGLWLFQLIQLIHLRYLCESAEREERMDVCFLLTLYIQYIIKFGGCQKWKVEENGQYGKIWKARDCGGWMRGKGRVGGSGREVRWLPPNTFFLTFL